MQVKGACDRDLEDEAMNYYGPYWHVLDEPSRDFYRNYVKSNAVVSNYCWKRFLGLLALIAEKLTNFRSARKA